MNATRKELLSLKYVCICQKLSRKRERTRHLFSGSQCNQYVPKHVHAAYAYGNNDFIAIFQTRLDMEVVRHQRAKALEIASSVHPRGINRDVPVSGQK